VPRQMKREKNGYKIQVVADALAILERFQCSVEELTLSELSRAMGLTKNSAFRILATLEALDYLELNELTRRYKLGWKNLEMGQKVIRRVGFIEQARPLMESLVSQCDETATLVIFRRGEVVNVAAVETRRAVRVEPRLGCGMPAYCTASGKLLLAFAGHELRRRALFQAEFRQYTPHTITDLPTLTRSLEQVSAKGYAEGDEELDPGVRGIAAPIRDYSRRMIGALTLFGPVDRFTRARIQDELLPKLLTAAVGISERLGYSASDMVGRSVGGST